MLVSELAKEFNTTTATVLEKLKTLRLKATGGSQDLSKAVVTVLRSELVKDLKTATAARVAAKVVKSRTKEVVKAPEPEKVAETKTKKGVVKKTATKKGSSKKKPIESALEDSSPEVSPLVENVATPAVVEVIKSEVKEVKESVTEKVEVPVVSPPAKAPVTPQILKPTAEEEAKGFVPLKPLAKKKRKVMGRSDSSYRTPDATSTDASSAAAQAAASAALPEVPQELKELEVQLPISVKDFAVRISEKTSVVLKKLMEMGVLANINQNLSEEVVRALALALGYSITKIKTKEEKLLEVHKAEEEDPSLLTPRGPVVTFMGHVDHGKTSLLDRIRKSRVADREHGGITQHIGAYSVKVPKGRITFLDTPGHEAFTAMRARGAHITDIVVIVIAADEGIMPQTEEAIDHARAAGVPIVIALNKIDKRNADVDRVKKQLMEHDLSPEDWGGKTIVVGVSATTGEGIDKLLEMMFLESEMLELKANSQKKSSGIVIEAHMSRGKGSLATLIVQSGTLRSGDMIVVGPYYGRVKAMFDDFEKPITEAGPSMPVEILGLPGVPDAGEMFYVVDNEDQAREITSVRVEQLKHERLHATSKITLEDLYTQIQQGKIKELNVILKADVQGSVEAIKDSLNKISTAEVKVNFIHTGVGDVNAADVILAFASSAIIIAFQVGTGPKATLELEKQPVDIRQYRIIYDAVSDVKKAMEGLLEPKKRRKFLARVEVRQVFKLSKGYTVAGCYVLKGKILRKASVDVIRGGEIIHTGAVDALKRFKDDVKEVGEGYECGVSLGKFEAFEPGDIIEAFETESIARTL
ncbi:MAG: translation initiation factor IF-2 [Candidatus Omnitrophica bacterium]|nr:translation initiation factor IF-2 [Candidatus Omnitrophota bacterium]